MSPLDARVEGIIVESCSSCLGSVIAASFAVVNGAGDSASAVRYSRAAEAIKPIPEAMIFVLVPGGPDRATELVKRL